MQTSMQALLKPHRGPVGGLVTFVASQTKIKRTCDSLRVDRLTGISRIVPQRPQCAPCSARVGGGVGASCPPSVGAKWASTGHNGAGQSSFSPVPGPSSVLCQVSCYVIAAHCPTVCVSLSSDPSLSFNVWHVPSRAALPFLPVCFAVQWTPERGPSVPPVPQSLALRYRPGRN